MGNFEFTQTVEMQGVNSSNTRIWERTETLNPSH